MRYLSTLLLALLLVACDGSAQQTDDDAADESELLLQDLGTEERELEPEASEAASAAAAPDVSGEPPAGPGASGELYLGEYACYGVGTRVMAGMGFILLPNGRYHDVDEERGGAYTYDPRNATIAFRGGFLDGQVGRNVSQKGFDLSSTVNCEPWR